MVSNYYARNYSESLAPAFLLYCKDTKKTSEITKHFVNYFVKFSKLTIDVFNARLELFRALRDENEIL